MPVALLVMPEVVELLVMLVTLLMNELRSRTPVPDMTRVLLGMALELPSRNVPALIVGAPPYVLAPPSVRIPAPALVQAPAPEITPEYVVAGVIPKVVVPVITRGNAIVWADAPRVVTEPDDMEILLPVMLNDAAEALIVRPTKVRPTMLFTGARRVDPANVRVSPLAGVTPPQLPVVAQLSSPPDPIHVINPTVFRLPVAAGPMRNPPIRQDTEGPRTGVGRRRRMDTILMLALPYNAKALLDCSKRAG